MTRAFQVAVLLLACFACSTAANAQRYYYPAQAFQDTGNGAAPGATPGESCEKWVDRQFPWWKSPPNSYQTEQIAGDRWRCQLYTNGAIQPSQFALIAPLCHRPPQAPIPPGAQWGLANRDTGTTNCWCAPGSVFDADIQWCVLTSAVCTGPACTNVDKAKGDACNTPGGGCTFANPIGAAFGNKQQRETDYAGSPPVMRLYDAEAMAAPDNPSLFGPRWASEYKARIEATTPLANYFCRKRADTGAVVCGRDLQNVASATSVRWRRGDGSRITFELVAGAYVATGDVSARLERLADAGGATIGWRATSEADDQTLLFDAAGRLLSISARDGRTRRLTYGDGLGGFLHSAPACAIAHPQVVGGNATQAGKVPLGTLLCVTDHYGKQVHFQYAHGNFLDYFNRVVTMIDPAGGVYSYQYGPMGDVLRVTFPDGSSRQYLYNEPAQINGSVACPFAATTGLPGRLTGLIDENGVRFASWTYNCAGLATSSERAGGVERYTASYPGDRVGAATSTVVTDPRGATRTYSFETVQGLPRHSALTGAVGPQFGAAAQTFDANGNVASRTDWNGNRTNYSYDLARNLETSRTEAFGTPQARTISTQWHPVFRLPTAIAEPLRITTNAYDTNGNLLSKSIQPTNDASGVLGFSAPATGTPRTTTFTYNGNGSVLTIDGPRSDATDVTTYTYYANDDADLGKRGNVATVTNGLGHTTSITAYNAHGQPLTVVDPNGLTTTMTYDARLRLEARSVGSEVTSYAYDNAGQLTRVTLPDGSFLEYAYDDAHRLTGISDNVGNRIAYTLDMMGNRTEEQVFDPANVLAQKRSREFNSLNRLFRELGAIGQATEYAYDNQGNVTSVKDPLEKVTANQYDALNRLRQVTDPGLGVTQYGYNGLDALVSVSDPRSLVTGYTVDGLGNLLQQQSPDTGSTANTYDVAGNLLTQSDAKGQVTSYAYDALNRVTLIAFHDGSKQQYAYDSGSNAVGRLSSITERDPADQQTNKTSYAYDQHGRVLTISTEHAGVIYNVGYSYDSAGRLTGLTYPSGRTVAYALDSLGRVNAIDTTKDGQTIAVLSGVVYHPFGGVKGFTLGNGHVYARGIDLDGRIASYTLGSQSFGINYDAASRITMISDLANAANMNTYGYDSLDRLTSAVLPGTPFAYSYDAVGNRTSKTVGSVTDAYTYSPTSNRIATAGSRSFTFDANGSTVADGANTFTYDARGRMVQATSAIGTTSYQLNALGQRIRKTTSLGDTVFHYDTAGKLIAETDPGGGVKRELIYLGDIPVFVWQ